MSDMAFLLLWSLVYVNPDSLCTTQNLLQSLGSIFRQYPTLAALAELAFTDNTQYMSTGNIEVLSWFLESVPPRLLAVNASPYGTKALSSMVQ